MKHSKLIETIPLSKVSSIIAHAMEQGWDDVIPMAGGEPTFNPPVDFVDTISRYEASALYKYSPLIGHKFLLEAIQKKLARRNGVELTGNNLIVLPGGASALFSAIRALADEGSEVIITDPCWEHYKSIIQLVSAKWKTWKLYKDSRSKELDFDSLESVISPNARCLLINTPLNPDGKIFSEYELKRIIEICKKKDIYLICDEEYEDFVYEKYEHISPRVFWDDVISLYSLSKGFGATGIRVGYVVAPESIIAQIKKVSLYTHMFSSSLSQCMAADLLSEKVEKHLHFISNLYKHKMDIFVEGLRNIDGVKIDYPQGGLYVFPEITPYRNRNAAYTLIDGFHLLCVPGDAAGDTTPSNVRFFIGLEDHQIYEALARIKKYCEIALTNG